MRHFGNSTACAFASTTRCCSRNCVGPRSSGDLRPSNLRADELWRQPCRLQLTNLACGTPPLQPPGSGAQLDLLHRFPVQPLALATLPLITQLLIPSIAV